MKTFFSIVLCTNDEEVEEIYHKIEKVAGVDLSLNYRGEKKQILQQRGSNFRFTFGDYVTKVMVFIIIHILIVYTLILIYSNLLY